MRITGYACACTPYTDHPGSGKATRRRDYNPGPRATTRRAPTAASRRASTSASARGASTTSSAGRRRQPAPPSLLDPFGGTGTTALVADVLGRIGIVSDRSADYCRLARWRTSDPGERARALGVPKPPPVPDGQDSLFDLEAS